MKRMKLCCVVLPIPLGHWHARIWIQEPALLRTLFNIKWQDRIQDTEVLVRASLPSFHIILARFQAEQSPTSALLMTLIA